MKIIRPITLARMGLNQSYLSIQRLRRPQGDFVDSTA
jgi:hypothetical protein